MAWNGWPCPARLQPEAFKRPVDLVVESAIRNPYFREAVGRDKALLYFAPG
jgi:hypothetical protein